MRVTAYLDSALAGTATTNASPGTWPVETLAFSSLQGFNNVVVHYDKPPVTGGDYGPIFIADNMSITPVAAPIILGQAARLGNGVFQFVFTNPPGASFSVLACTNPALPLASWSLLGSPAQIAPGVYQFTDAQAGNSSARFYRVRSP